MKTEVTKRREPRPGLLPCWRLYFNGARTALFIEKAREEPKWGSSQVYDLGHDAEGFLMDGSVYGLIEAVKAITNAAGLAQPRQDMPLCNCDGWIAPGSHAPWCETQQRAAP